MSRDDGFPHFNELDPQKDAGMFQMHIRHAKKANKYGAAVDVHKVDEYKNMRLFMTVDGMAGYAVNKDGELNSVFRHPKSGYKNVAQHAAEHAQLIGGATHASAFDWSLPNMYKKGGMAPLSHVQWNEEYKPKGWKVSFQGRPDVVFLGATHQKVGPTEEYTRDSTTPETTDYESGMETAKKFGEASKPRRPQ